MERFGRFKGAERFAREWMHRALQAQAERAGPASLEGVPVQAIRIGPLRIVALPGEPFTRLGKRIRDAFPSTWVVGYANGSIGYLPTREAFADPGDYACYCAPRFVSLFPFTEDLEDILVGAGVGLLAAQGGRDGPTPDS